MLTAFHGKASEATPKFLAALREVLAVSAPDECGVVAIGMDANVNVDEAWFEGDPSKTLVCNHNDGSPDAMTRELSATAGAVNPAQRSVSKVRTPFQTQIEKIGKYDISMKDFVYGWHVGAAAHSAATRASCGKSNPRLSHTLSIPKGDDAAAPGTARSDRLTSSGVPLTQYYPDIRDDGNYLLPTVEWPFDHAMAIAEVTLLRKEQ